VDCHTDISDYPHPDVKVKNTRDFTLTFTETCKECHEEQYLKTHDSVHQKALDEGNKNAAVCMDCHNPHTQTRLTGKTSGELTPSARLHIPETCAKCHSIIYNTYRESVHGNALTEEGNTDVPTCIDCHGVHNIQAPTSVTPQIGTYCNILLEMVGKFIDINNDQADKTQQKQHQGNTQDGHKIGRFASFDRCFSALRHAVCFFR